MQRPIPIGIDEFRENRDLELENVDKTHLIRELLDNVGTDATYIKINVVDFYLYRAVNRSGAMASFLLSSKRDATAAKRIPDRDKSGERLVVMALRRPRRSRVAVLQCLRRVAVSPAVSS